MMSSPRRGLQQRALVEVLDGNLDELVEPLSAHFQAERLREEMARA